LISIEKRRQESWTCPRAVAIVFALCQFGIASADATGQVPDAGSAELRTAEAARRHAEQRCTELSASLLRAERELEELRRRYASLYLEAGDLQKKLEGLNFSAARLLETDTDPAGTQTIKRLLARLEDMQAGQDDLHRAAEEFKDYLGMVLDILQPSDVLRGELTKRLDALLERCEQLAQPPSQVAGRGGEELLKRGCRVLAVNDELQTVILSAGSAEGIGRGTIWHVPGREKQAVQLKVIEVRTRLSAAMVTEGRVDQVAPGMVAKPGEKP